ncbi:hypothetical protein ACET3Z_013652 [Daucus carota]
MHEFYFNNDGLLSQEALNLLDGGNLDCFSGAPLDSLVNNADSRALDGLLNVKSVLQLMGFGKADKVGGVRMLGPYGL